MTCYLIVLITVGKIGLLLSSLAGKTRNDIRMVSQVWHLLDAGCAVATHGNWSIASRLV